MLALLSIIRPFICLLVNLAARIVCMLRAKKGRFWNSAPYYNYQRGIKQRRFGPQSRFHIPYLVSLFCFMTFTFAFVFSGLGGWYKTISADNQPSVIKTKGLQGVSSPKGASLTKTSLSNPKRTPATTIPASILPIPPKPAWVNLPLYTDPTNTAAEYAANNPSADGVAYIKRMSQVPVAQWFGDWNTSVANDVNNYISAANNAGKVPVVVAYNIPNRDCGGYSVGGSGDLANYLSWFQQLANGIGSRTAVVVLEPDALGALDCLPANKQPERTKSIAQAVSILKSHSKTYVYIDAGTPVWQPANVMSSRLKAANIAAADGFSINVSYFAPTWQNQSYGDQLSSLVGYKHYVIDTSRNGGNHSLSGMQCNPSFASLGQEPTTDTGKALNDALLWIKIPWESDGQCNGSPGPGQPFWSYAVQLARQAGW